MKNFYWVDITVKVMADSAEQAETVAGGAAVRMEADNAGVITLKGIEVDLDSTDDAYWDEYADIMPYDHFNE